MNFGLHIDTPEVLVHCKLTQVHTPRGSFRSHSNQLEAYWCTVKRRFKTMVDTTEEMLLHTSPSTCGGSDTVRLPNLQRHIAERYSVV